jgi:hypothetical protein
MPEHEPQNHPSLQENLLKIWFYTDKSVEFLVRIVGLPATLGLFSPQEKSTTDVVIRGSFDILTWVLWAQFISQVETAGWDRELIRLLGIAFLACRFVGVSTVDLLKR